MSINDMPNEILEHIFENLCHRDIIKCREASRRWKDVVDNDTFWKKRCAKDHSDVYEDAYRKACLSWRELYRSLSLWAKVSSAEVKISKIGKCNGTFRILRDGILVVPSAKNCKSRYFNVSNTVAYYDLATLEELNTQSFDLAFTDFQENDKLIVMEFTNEKHGDKYLKVIIKSNRINFLYGKEEGICSWMIYERGVYFQYMHLGSRCTRINHFGRVKLVEQNNDITLEYEDLHNSERISIITGVSSISINSEDTIILTHNRQILLHRGTELKIYNCIGNRSKYKRILKRYHLNESYMSNDNYLYYGKTLVSFVNINLQKINIFYDIQASNYWWHLIDIESWSLSPAKSVSMGKVLNASCNYRHWAPCQIDIVEIQNGHKVIIKVQYELFVIELSHDPMQLQ